MLKKLLSKESSSQLTKNSKGDVILRLMFEIAVSDGKLSKNELDMIRQKASNVADNDQKVSTVIKKIIDETQDSTSLYPSAVKINETFSKEEKEELLKLLWQLVISDKAIDAYEENLYFKIAELIKIKRSTANQIKQQVT
jgi:uncharacterized tellurite resistance protein B-like protein